MRTQYFRIRKASGAEWEDLPLVVPRGWTDSRQFRDEAILELLAFRWSGSSVCLQEFSSNIGNLGISCSFIDEDWNPFVRLAYSAPAGSIWNPPLVPACFHPMTLTIEGLPEWTVHRSSC